MIVNDHTFPDVLNTAVLPSADCDILVINTWVPISSLSDGVRLHDGDCFLQ